MAVEARHLNLFPSQLIPDRDMGNPPTNQGNAAYNSQQMRVFGMPENQSFYQNVVCDSVKAKTSVNTDSGLTYNIHPPPRKRSRDSINNNQFYAAPNFPATQKNNSVSQFPSFVGSTEDLSSQMNQYQLEIDSLISQHTKKIRLEIEERQKQQARLMVASIGEGVMKKLKEKEDQIQRMGKYNLVLQERVKSLYVENQLWRDLAQSNEATANSLRSNLEQVLANVGGEGHVSAVEDDAESYCCGSSDHGRRDVDGSHDKEGDSDRTCKRCGERESCVLLLPCRHLCLCNVCGSGSNQIQTCPVCNSNMTATLHVNMSS
ncbi:hypothetical protein BUALT_Bualt03G0009500 [Buddleja alternifolia]|uniref:RING-type domain-containing protein n=1 Tax=Buddleja alternifolia TaxID=168488 RepID=A0AAV6XYG6_9LAMI|nr:hypothetical protein BUALT_Bualt03G0009500 [Buddleja alternifolia]